MKIEHMTKDEIRDSAEKEGYGVVKSFNNDNIRVFGSLFQEGEDETMNAYNRRLWELE